MSKYGFINLLIVFNLLSEYPKEYPQNKVLTEKLYKMLEDFHGILAAHHMPYIIIGGTLLGAVRDQKLIPWDDDIDMAIFQEDLERFQLIREVFEKRGYQFNKCPYHEPTFFKICPEDGWDCEERWFTKYPCIDVVVYEKKGDKYMRNYHGPTSFNVKDMFPLKIYNVGSLKIFGPNNPLSYLNTCYPKWDTHYVIWKPHNYEIVFKS